jgi:hypothetical protein
VDTDNLGGVYGGLGGSLTYMTTNSSNVFAFSVNVPNDPFENFRSNTSNMGAVAQVGYWSKNPSKIRWGLNFTYSYQNMSTNYVLSDSNDFFQNSDTQLDATFSLLGMLAIEAGDTHLYIGGGPVWFRGVASINQMFTNIGQNARVDRNMFGGIGRVGLIYHLNESNFLDAGFSLGASSKKAFPATLIGGGTLTRDIAITTANVALTFNHRFAS